MPTLLRQQAYPFGSLRKGPHWSVQGLVFYSQFSPAGKLIDESPFGNDGTITGATWVGNGLLFNGVDTWVSLGTSINMAGWSELTVIAWIRPSSGAAVDLAVVGNLTSGNNEANILLRIDRNTGNLDTFLVEEANAVIGGDSGEAIDFDQWNQIAMTWRAGGVLQLYINGNPTATTFASSAVMDASASTELFIGLRRIGHADKMTGVISDAKLYNRTLSASEIAALNINPNLPMQQEPIWLFAPPVVSAGMAGIYYRTLMQGVA